MSSHTEVYNIYIKYINDIHLFQYDGFMDKLHLMNLFEGLYNSIKISSLFIVFIDTDEFLCMYKNDKIYTDTSIVNYIQKNHNKTSFPTHWLSNYIYEYNKFIFHADKKIISNNLKHGKIILNTKLIFNPCTNLFHTKLASVDALENTSCNFLLLHRKTSNINQRLKTNINKLKCLGIINEYNYNYINKIDISSIKDIRGRKFITEIRSFINRDISKYLFKDYISINNNTIAFSSPDVQNLFERYVNEKISFFHAVQLPPIKGAISLEKIYPEPYWENIYFGF